MAIPETDLQRARAAIVAVISRYVPALKKNGIDYHACCPFHDEKSPSFTVSEDKEFFHCFGCGASGSTIDFIMKIENCDFQTAVEKINGSITVEPAPRKKPAPQPWQQIGYQPAGLPEPEIIHPMHGAPSAKWAYQTPDGEIIGYTCRYDKPDGKKDVLPFTWCKHIETGAEQFRWKGFSMPRPLYGLETINNRPAHPILIVEGEKTADAARVILPNFNVITWSGGAQASGKHDWSPVHGRSITIWPDGDEPGINAAHEIYQALKNHCENIRLVPPPFMDGWDLADVTPDFDPKAYAKKSALPASEYFAPAHTVIEHTEPRTGSIMLDIFPDAFDYLSPLPDTNSKGKPLATIENLREIIHRLNINVRYNVIKKELEIIIPNQSFTVDNQANASIAWIQSRCAKIDYPLGNLLSYLGYLADKNLYNPVATWIESKPWDGINRLQSLLDTVTTADPDDTNQKNMLITRWLTSAVAAAFLPDGVSAHGVLVFQGDQAIGKTQWIKSLAPADMRIIQDGIILRPDSTDSVKQAVSNWIVELGELDATFRKADIAQLKAFIPRDKDVLRRPYAVTESHFARRTVFFASVNPQQFLQDETGNRRYWTVACEHINHDHGIDMQQVWAEVYENIFMPWYRSDRGTSRPWLLDPDDMWLLTESNKRFDATDPIKEKILSRYDWDAKTTLWEWKTATSVMAEIGYDKPNRGEVTHAAIVILAMNEKMKKRGGGKNFLLVPPKTINCET